MRGLEHLYAGAAADHRDIDWYGDSGVVAAERDHYQQLFDCAPIPYLVLDRVGVIIEVNTAATEFLKRPRAVLLQSPLLFFFSPRDRRKFLEHMRRCRQTHEAVSTELSIFYDKGSDHPVLLSSVGLEGAHVPITFRTVIIDLSERKRWEETLARSARLASMGTFTAGMAHEINNPLNTIQMQAQVLLSSRNSTQQDYREALVRIVEEVARCARIVKNMLHFARQETTQKWPVNFNELVVRAARMAQNYVPNCNVVVSLAPEPAPRILANPTEIEQLIVNLVKNAVEATPREVRVQLHVSVLHDSVKLEVSDNGPGIPHEQLPHLFDPFFTTKRGHGGTGLGLSVVHAIVDSHGGTIKVESEPGAGTRFVVTFPNRLIEVENGASAGS